MTQIRSAKAQNFIRAMAAVSEVQALRIVQPTNIAPLMRMDSLSRFLLDRIGKELSGSRVPVAPSGGPKAAPERFYSQCNALLLFTAIVGSLARSFVASCGPETAGPCMSYCLFPAL